MSETRSFLARWSERKRAEARAERAPEPPRQAEPSGGVETGAIPGADAPAAGAPPPEQSVPLDLEALPSLEDITGETDIGAFLRRGVPGDLRNAALRRAWSSDPTISRFIEMADYDWDFNTPGGNQVFGPLSSAVDAARMAAEILNPQPRAAPEAAETEGPDEEVTASRYEPAEIESPQVPNVVSSTEDDRPLTRQVIAAAELSEPLSNPLPVARNSPELLEFEVTPPSASVAETEAPAPPRRRRHGGALPDSK